jgi:two-component system, NarL family, sensor histidine kinase UhpB
MKLQLRILILEDQITDGELMAYELRQAKIAHVIRRVDTEAAFSRELDDYRPDLILSDYHLPGFNGLAALGLAQEKCPEVPFIFVSGAMGEEVAIESLKRGATDYVLKDRLTRLGPAVTRALREKVERQERRQAEVALTESEQKYRLLVKSIPAVVYRGYNDCTVDFIDDKIEELTGYPREDFDSRCLKWDKLVVPLDYQKFKAAFVAGLKSNKSFIREYRITNKDGQVLWIQDRGQIVCNAAGQVQYVSGVFFDISERRRGEEALRESERGLRFLTSQLLHAQEQERKRISMELHDELGQSLTVLKMQVRAIERNLGTEQQQAKTECGELLQYLDGVIDNVRRLSRDLCPSILEDLGLQSSLKYLAEGFGKHYIVKQSFEVKDLDHLFPQEAQIIIYRIFQESLNNISKHAQATEVLMGIQQQDGVVEIILEDNGVGFDVPAALRRDPSKPGMGLAALGERTRMLGGVMEIKSQAGSGTRITCRVPVVNPRGPGKLNPGSPGQ